MLRIYFTAADLARTRIADVPDPLWETALSVNKLGMRPSEPRYRVWQRDTGRKLADTTAGSASRLLRQLIPAQGYWPDFLTPTADSPSLTAGIDALLTTPRDRLDQEMRRLALQQPLPRWTDDLALGVPRALDNLADALHTYHHAALTPHWTDVCANAHADRAVRARALAEGGVEGLFASLAPMVRWCPPVLEVDYVVDRDIHLNGRGIRLISAVFCGHPPVGYANPTLPPVLVYPITLGTTWDASTLRQLRDDDPLTALLGRTRAAVLRAIADGHTTTELAQLTAVSDTSISTHTGVLRNAGFITTHRYRNAVLHTLTPLGTAVLTAHSAG